MLEIPNGHVICELEVAGELSTLSHVSAPAPSGWTTDAFSHPWTHRSRRLTLQQGSTAGGQAKATRDATQRDVRESFFSPDSFGFAFRPNPAFVRQFYSECDSRRAGMLEGGLRMRRAAVRISKRRRPPSLCSPCARSAPRPGRKKSRRRSCP